MILNDKIGNRYYLIIISFLILINLINNSNIKSFESLRMNDFFSGAFIGILIPLAFVGMLNYIKTK